MSRKSTIIATDTDDNVYWDCTKQFESEGKCSSELIFDFNKKNITEYSNDENELIFGLDRDSDIYRQLKAFFI